MLSKRTNGRMMVMLLIWRTSSGDDPCQESRRMLPSLIVIRETTM